MIEESKTTAESQSISASTDKNQTTDRSPKTTDRTPEANPLEELFTEDDSINAESAESQGSRSPKTTDRG